MRSVSQIYSEIVTTRNNYLQLTELNSGRSNSKLSILNLLSYVMAVAIHTYEAILDTFQVKVALALNGRINGTPDWYVMMAKKFQYNPVTESGDELKFNENTLKIEYATVDTSHRIINQAAWQTGEDGNSIILKVCKANSNTSEINNGVPYMELSHFEMTAFKLFIQEIKFVGANVYAESLPADILTIIADKKNPIYYNDSYVTAAQAIANLQKAMIDFANNMKYNELLYYQSVIDVLRKTDNIVDVSAGVKVTITSYNDIKEEYNAPSDLVNRVRLRSGYIKLQDLNSALTINSTNLTLIPASKMDEYIKEIEKEENGGKTEETKEKTTE